MRPAEPFVERHGLWSDAQHADAERLRGVVEEHDLEVVRVSFPDLYGLPRGKSFMRDSFLRGLDKGFEMGAAPLLLGSADERLFDSFGRNPAGVPQLSGSANLVVVPDPSTFRVLPWAPGTGWVVGDVYFPDGTACPLATRSVLQGALARLRDAGFTYRVGLEVEGYLFKIEDPKLGVTELGGGPGVPADPPAVSAVAHGYKYLHESHLDQIDDVLRPVRSALLGLDLPLRSTDDEWGPGQVEFVFDPIDGLAAADAMFLFRTAVKQVCRRLGYLATFMCKPRIPACIASGWHLHQSLIDAATGENAFVPAPDEDLSAVARHFVGGLLAHAVPSSLFNTPTVNGYRRRRPFSLAPDRVTWGIDHRGVMVRVWGTGDPAAFHLENRVGEPAANPYLYMASQVVAGLDGLTKQIDPGPASVEPYRETDKPILPATFMDALDELRADEFFRAEYGDVFVDYVLAVSDGKLQRFLDAVGGRERAVEQHDEVSEWEQREYFERF